MAKKSAEDFGAGIIDGEYTIKYAFLSRMKADLEYYFGAGGHHPKHLYYDSIEQHIKETNKLLNSLPEAARPEWLTKRDMDIYSSKIIENTSVADYFKKNTFLEHQVEQIQNSQFGDDILYTANQVRLTLNQDHKEIDEFAVIVSDKLNSKRLNEQTVVESLMFKYNCSIVFAKPAFDLIKDLKINIEAPLSKAAYEEVEKAISAEKKDGPTSQRLSDALTELSKHDLDKDLFQDTIDKVECLPESKLFQGKFAKESTKEMAIKAPVSEKAVDFSPTV